MKAEEHQIGAHRIDVEGDMVICRYRGAISMEEIKLVHDVIEDVLKTQGHCYQLLDLHTVKTLEPPVRRWISQWAQTHTLEAVLGFDASSLMFVLVGLMTRAIYSLRKDKRPTVLILKSEAQTMNVAGGGLGQIRRVEKSKIQFSNLPRRHCCPHSRLIAG